MEINREIDELLMIREEISNLKERELELKYKIIDFMTENNIDEMKESNHEFIFVGERKQNRINTKLIREYLKENNIDEEQFKLEVVSNNILTIKRFKE